MGWGASTASASAPFLFFFNPLISCFFFLAGGRSVAVVAIRMALDAADLAATAAARVAFALEQRDPTHHHTQSLVIVPPIRATRRQSI